MYVFMHGTCQNGAAISISVQVQGPAQAPIVLPILQHCDLPQSRVPPLCCVLFWLATTRRIYMNTCIRRVTHAGSREHSLKRTHQIRENTAIPTAAHVCTKNTSHSHIHVHLYTAKTLEVYLWAVLSHAPLFRSMLEAKSSESCRCISTLAAVLVEGKHAAANRSGMWVWV